MNKMERLEAARERVRAWKKGHPKSVVWQKARWYRRKKELAGKRRVGVGVEVELKESNRTVVERREVEETHVEAFGPGVDMAYEERVYQDRRPASEPGIVRTVMERPIEISEEEAERTRTALERLEVLKERQASGNLNAGVEVELEL